MSDHQGPVVSNEAYIESLQQQVSQLTGDLSFERARRIQAERALALMLEKHPEDIDPKAAEVKTIQAGDGVDVQVPEGKPEPAAMTPVSGLGAPPDGDIPVGTGVG